MLGRGDTLLNENDDIFGFENLSDGEKNLFNIIIQLATLKETKPKLIIIDEPEIFMHDDMIISLANSIQNAVKQLKDSYFIISTHSSTLIEEFASISKRNTNLILINSKNGKKEVSNSDENIGFINALKENGVRFSPLYLTNAKNIFIENDLKKGKVHRDFLLSFFDSNEKPNIIPIGSSGQLSDFSKFEERLKDLLNMNYDSKSIGIIDGDIWFTSELGNLNNLKIIDFVNVLKSLKKVLIKSNIRTQNRNIYYFNFWEIENLYFADELLCIWQKGSQVLNKTRFIEIIKNHREDIVNSWLNTHRKSILKPIYPSRIKNKDNITSKLNLYKKYFEEETFYWTFFNNLFDSILNQNLLHWFPGKELHKFMKKEDYVLKLNNIDINQLEITKEIRSIL